MAAMKFLVAAACVAAALGDAVKVKSLDGSLIITAEKDVQFNGAENIQINGKDGASYTLEERFAALETGLKNAEAVAAAALTQANFSAFVNNLKKNCPVGSVVESISADGSLVCSSAVQQRVKGVCADGLVLSVVNEDGSVKCVNPEPKDSDWQRKVKKACPKGEVMVSVATDGTPTCIKSQSPVNNTCPEGFSISKIAQDGKVSCEKGGPSFDRRTHYITWGKQQCEGTGELVYSGFMIGAHYNRAGGPVEHQCLPVNGDMPSGHANTDRSNQDGGVYRRVEFRDQYQIMVNPRFYIGSKKGMNFRDLACAVCVSKQPAHLMIPGAVDCPAGWTKDYRGYLTGSRYSERTSAGFTCLHEYMQKVAYSSSGNNYGARLYPTEYQNPSNWNDAKHDFEVSCVECTADSNDKPLSTFTRWGRTDCGTTARTLYQGWVGAGHNTHYGGGATYQCMNNNLGYTGAEGGTNNDGAHIWEVQYDTHSKQIPAWTALNGYEVPCAVCEVEAQTTMNIPGREECPTGYEANYKGWIASGYFTHRHVTENICVDEKPVKVEGSSKSKRNWGRMYAAEVFRAADNVKGAAYKDGQEARCVQCTATKSKKTVAYTTWGRKKCPAKSTTLSSGWMANAMSTLHGGGHNYLCMANVAQKGKSGTWDPKRNFGGQLAHVDYRQSLISKVGGPGSRRMVLMNGHDAACSLCEVEAEDVKMFAGLTKCPSGYGTVYTGYLMSGWHTHPHDTSAVCVEKDFEPVDKSKKGVVNGHQMFTTEIESPVSGQKAKYATNGEMSCAVCTL